MVTCNVQDVNNHWNTFSNAFKGRFTQSFPLKLIGNKKLLLCKNVNVFQTKRFKLDILQTLPNDNNSYKQMYSREKTIMIFNYLFSKTV